MAKKFRMLKNFHRNLFVIDAIATIKLPLRRTLVRSVLYSTKIHVALFKLIFPKELLKLIN